MNLLLVVCVALSRGQKIQPRTIHVWRAPSRHISLVLREEGDEGDFIWRRLYLRTGKRLRLIDLWNYVDHVRWSRSGNRVEFMAIRAIGPHSLKHELVVFSPASGKITRRQVRIERMGGE